MLEPHEYVFPTTCDTREAEVAFPTVLTADNNTGTADDNTGTADQTIIEE